MTDFDRQILAMLSDPLEMLFWIFGLYLAGFLFGLLIAWIRRDFRLVRTPFIVSLLLLYLALSAVLGLTFLWIDRLGSGGFGGTVLAQAGLLVLLSGLLGLFSGARGRDGFGAVAAGLLMLVPLVFLWLTFRPSRLSAPSPATGIRARVSGERGVLLIVILLTLNIIAGLWLDKRMEVLELPASEGAAPPVSRASQLTDAEKAALAADLKAWADGFIIPFALNDEFTLTKVHSTHVMGFLHLQAGQPYVEQEDDQAFFAPVPCEDEQLVALFERGAQALVLIIDPDGSNTGVFGYSAAYCGQ